MFITAYYDFWVVFTSLNTENVLRKENVAQIKQKVARSLLEKVACMKCFACLRKVKDDLLNATKNLLKEKQVYCYRLNAEFLYSFFLFCC